MINKKRKQAVETSPLPYEFQGNEYASEFFGIRCDTRIWNIHKKAELSLLREQIINGNDLPNIEQPIYMDPELNIIDGVARLQILVENGYGRDVAVMAESALREAGLPPKFSADNYTDEILNDREHRFQEEHPDLCAGFRNRDSSCLETEFESGSEELTDACEQPADEALQDADDELFGDLPNWVRIVTDPNEMRYHAICSQLGRRNQDRRTIALRLYPIYRNSHDSVGMSKEDFAKVAKVSKRRFQRAGMILRYNGEAAIDRIELGKSSVNKEYREAEQKRREDKAKSKSTVSSADPSDESGCGDDRAGEYLSPKDASGIYSDGGVESDAGENLTIEDEIGETESEHEDQIIRLPRLTGNPSAVALLCDRLRQEETETVRSIIRNLSSQLSRNCPTPSGKHCQDSRSEKPRTRRSRKPKGTANATIGIVNA